MNLYYRTGFCAPRQIAVFTILLMFCLSGLTSAAAASGCVSVSTNTGSGHPTTLAPGYSGYTMTLSEPSSSLPDNQLFVASYNDTGSDVYFFNYDGTLALYDTPLIPGNHYKSVILKDPLKLFIASWSGVNMGLCTVTISGGVYSLSSPTLNTVTYNIGIITNDPGTTYFLTQATNAKTVFRYNLPFTATAYTGLANGVDTATFMGITTDGTKLVIGDLQYLSLYNKADFSQIKAFQGYFYDNGAVLIHHVLDNMNTYRLFALEVYNSGSGSYINIYNFSSPTVDTDTPSWTGGAAGFSTNNILNFGPYQYVVTIQAAVVNPQILFFSKKTAMSTGTSTVNLSNTVAQVYNSSTPSFTGLVMVASNFYFGFINLDTGGNVNFQSYYLTVADCTSRDASRVCQTCIAGYYKTDLNPDNVCIPLSDFNAGYGIDAANNAQAPCTGNGAAAGCLSCLNDYTKCTTCDVANNYYNLNGQCYLYASIPNGYGIVTAGLQTLAACTDPNCLQCVANKDTCTQCNTSSGYYTNIGTSKCESVATATDSYGFNSGTNQFEHCTDTNCQKCAADKNTCTQCLTANGFYWNIGTLKCESVATATNTYGFNSGTSQFEHCSDTNCQVCAADKNKCTQCQTSTTYYLNIGTHKCESMGTVTDTYGFNSGTSQFESCTDTNCQLCAADKTSCTQCLTINGFYPNVGTSKCESVATASDTYGFNSGTHQFEHCTDIHCQKCAADKTNCTQCLTANGYYWNIGTFQCENLGTVSDTYGFNSGTNQFEHCTDTNCQVCAADKTNCTQCLIANGYYWNIGTFKCESVATVTDTYGFNSGTHQFEHCTDTNCQFCAADKTNCTQCLIANGFYWNIGTTQCESVATATSTYGFNSGTSQFESCTDTNCHNCAADKNKCNKCQPSSTYYLNIGTHKCESMGTVTDTYGFNSGTSQFESCTDTNCQLCAADKTSCTQCLTINGFYPNVGTSKCESVATVTDTYGFNSGTNQFEPCTDTNCQFCAADKNKCTRCQISSQYYWFNESSQCIQTSAAASGYGANLKTYDYEICKEANCIQCASNYQVCTVCDQANGYTLVGGQCIPNRTESTQQSYTAFSASTSTASVTFQGDITVNSGWGPFLGFSFQDMKTKKQYTDPTIFKFSPTGAGFDVEIDIDGYFEDAKLFIFKKSPPASRLLQATDPVPDAYFPIIVNNITVLNTVDQKKMSGAAGAVVGSMDKQRAVANIVLMNVNMNAATLLDRLVSDYQYLALIGKQNLTYTRFLLDPALDVKLAPFTLPGTDKETKQGALEKKTSYPKCYEEYFYFRNKVKCGFFENYGSDFITMIFILIVTSLLTMLGIWLRKKQYLDDYMTEPHKDATGNEVLRYHLNQVGCLITITFGLQFFSAKMEANAMKIMIFALLNIYKMDGSWQMGVGFAVSIIVLAYYGLYIYMAWSFARHLSKEIVSHAQSKLKAGKYRAGPIEDSIKMEKLKFGFMGKPYLQLRNDLSFVDTYFPVILVLKNIAIALFIVMLSSRPRVTPIMTALTELALLGFCLYTRARAKRLENVLDIFNCLCRAIYCILAAITFQYEVIPVSLDVGMFIVLLLSTMGTLFFTVGIIILTVYDALMIIFSKSSLENRFKSSEERMKEKFPKAFLDFRHDVFMALEKQPDELKSLFSMAMAEQKAITERKKTYMTAQSVKTQKVGENADFKSGVKNSSQIPETVEEKVPMGHELQLIK